MRPTALELVDHVRAYPACTRRDLPVRLGVTQAAVDQRIHAARSGGGLLPSGALVLTPLGEAVVPADPRQRWIRHLILHRDHVTTCDAAVELDITVGAVHVHVARMRRAGLLYPAGSLFVATTPE